MYRYNSFELDDYVTPFIGLCLRCPYYLYSIMFIMGLSRVYFGRRPGDLVHHLLVIAPHPLFDFVVPVCAKPNHGVL